MTIGEAFAAAVARLRRAGIESPQRDARLLLATATGFDTAILIGWPERALPPGAEEKLDAMVERRSRREPVSKILGRREFWSLDLAVTADTLDPRPDSETLIEAALVHLPSDRPNPLILDLGTGTGALLLALLSELPAVRGLGVDRSEAAIRVARANAESVGLADRASFVVADWDAPLAARFDLVVSNPPYIPSATIESLDPEVRLYDPLGALDGGTDGLDAYRALARRLPDRLLPGGTAVLELGIGQTNAVAALMVEAGLQVVEARPDLAGIPRALVACLPDAPLPR